MAERQFIFPGVLTSLCGKDILNISAGKRAGNKPAGQDLSCFLSRKRIRMQVSSASESVLSLSWDRESDGALQVFPVHVDAGNLVIFIGSIVVHAFVCITAGGVEGDFVFPVSQAAASLLLFHGS